MSIQSLETLHVETSGLTLDVCITNSCGLHARPTAELVRLVQGFQCSVHLLVRGKRLNAGSILDLLCANLCFGSKLTLVAEGHDAAEALTKLGAFFANLANEDFATHPAQSDTPHQAAA